MSLLKVQGVVRLARDVEIKYSQSGSAIANFSIVSSSKYKTQSGEQKEDTCFIDAVSFGRLGEICNQYLKKGSKIKIDGELKLESWTAQDGTKRSKHSINIKEMEMLDSKADNMDKGTELTTNAPEQQPSQLQNQQATIPTIDIANEDIPFGPIDRRL